MRYHVDSLRAELLDRPARDLLETFFRRYANRIALASSLGAEDQVLTDMILGIEPAARIFTLDTGRLHQKTYDVMTETMKRYRMKYEVYCPQSGPLEELLREQGPNAFFMGKEAREECCRVRKLEPLERALDGLEVWVTGLRREQAVSRRRLERIEWDGAHGLIKLNPLADWSTEQVWNYIRENDVPYNHLHDEGYPSIGCLPCTRAAASGLDLRSGRWWWEEPEHRECGLHAGDGEAVRRVQS